ncbi:hypothetical protein FQR65_LT06538 [Abscondita terminalis]|nr:hypothetical protein FQR65_LT06538 [Abscondita terminalis]
MEKNRRQIADLTDRGTTFISDQQPPFTTSKKNKKRTNKTQTRMNRLCNSRLPILLRQRNPKLHRRRHSPSPTTLPPLTDDTTVDQAPMDEEIMEQDDFSLVANKKNRSTASANSVAEPNHANALKIEKIPAIVLHNRNDYDKGKEDATRSRNPSFDGRVPPGSHFCAKGGTQCDYRRQEPPARYGFRRNENLSTNFRPHETTNSVTTGTAAEEELTSEDYIRSHRNRNSLSSRPQSYIGQCCRC